MAKQRSTYHHGDLRAALLRAGEQVLADTGPAGFSLREVARRVGVSHAAPAHHFGDTQGLLSALATEGFRRLLAAMRARQATAGPDARDRLLASGLGYVDCARSSPALFRLMFGDERIATPDPNLSEAGEAAFRQLCDDVEKLLGVSPFSDERAMARVAAAWSLVHGFVTLLNAGHMGGVGALTGDREEAFFRSALAPLLEADAPAERKAPQARDGRRRRPAGPS
ncbi:TetR/AcrR family transcriptional regulator [uncultured Alsobacter sp.]|uniref:TetR/AcrR family transcriptional regulator n=1 Tax=uncultured Alsobacter sp. TaxID=1748258 RepID=UPI0026002377|nr:TetR/AcrR family transcriptional regulator [uncultured Alsobacter sp.]